MAIQVVILAAGQGKRMYSALPKVLHLLAGKPMLEHVISTAIAVSPKVTPIVIYGHEGEKLRAQFAHLSVRWVEQREQLGTGHALLQALPLIHDDDHVLVLYGDVPLIAADTLQKLIAAAPQNGLAMLTAHLDKPTGYGRIKRDQAGRIIAIVEEKDATETERAIREINPGIYLVPAMHLKKWLPRLKNHNEQKEYYLTDIIAMAVAEKLTVEAVQPAMVEEIAGVNDKLALVHLERFHQRQLAENLLRQGVMVLDPNRLDIRGEVKIGREVIIDVNVIFEGRVVIGDGCVIGPNNIIRDTTLGAKVIVKTNSVIEEAEIAAGCVIGPFARIRPGSVLGTEVHIGNFVEVKNSKIDHGSKANHLSYLGDSEVGKRVNIGAGTITCNYDGANKHKTIIGDDVHIGSGSELVAPVTIGEGATIAAGSTITQDAPAHQLILTQQLQQRGIKDWQRPVKKAK